MQLQLMLMQELLGRMLTTMMRSWRSQRRSSWPWSTGRPGAMEDIVIARNKDKEAKAMIKLY